MGTFQSFLASNGIKEIQIIRASNRIEANTKPERALRVARAAKRRTQADKKYAELNIAKPKAGRGISTQHLIAAAADKPLPRKVRSKLLRAVNVLLESKKKPAVDMKALFDAVGPRVGAKPKNEKAGNK